MRRKANYVYDHSQPTPYRGPVYRTANRESARLVGVAAIIVASIPWFWMTTEFWQSVIRTRGHEIPDFLGAFISFCVIVPLLFVAAALATKAVFSTAETKDRVASSLGILAAVLVVGWIIFFAVSLGRAGSGNDAYFVAYQSTITEDAQDWVKQFQASSKSPSAPKPSDIQVYYYGSGFTHSANMESLRSRIVILTSPLMAAYGYPGMILGFADGHVELVPDDRLHDVMNANNSARNALGLPTIQ